MNTTPLVISALCGGLGNQMFQYAAGRALALRLNAKLKLDLTWFSQTHETPREYQLTAFPIVASVASSEEIQRLSYAPHTFLQCLFRRPLQHGDTYYQEHHFHYGQEFATISGNAYLNGYWQSEKYFSSVAKNLQQDFSFPPLPNASHALVERIVNSNAVAIHIRRGDYVAHAKTNEIHGLCTPDYYQQAIEAIRTQNTTGMLPHLFLFSDDPRWVANNFDSKGLATTIVDFPEHRDAPWHDMHLMRLCRSHIIANSSFSWWGAWLSTSSYVYAPKRWFAAARRNDASHDIIPKRWVKL